MAESEFLTTAQVLDFLQIGRTKLWLLVRDGAFPAYRIGEAPSAPLRYRRSDIEVWVEGQRVNGTPASDAAKPRSER